MKRSIFRKKKSIIPAAIAAFIIIFCAATWFLTPLFMVKPVFNEEAYDRIDSEALAEHVILPGAGLSGWLINEPGTDALIIYFGGINEDASSAILNFIDLKEKGFYSGFDIAVMDWPGYGKSEGSAGAETLRKAALQTLYHFSIDEKRNCIYLLGYSMGTGPAVYAASKWDCSGLILIAPYDSAADLYNNVINIFHGPLVNLLQYKMPAGEYAASVKVSPLIIASSSDNRVPFSSSVSLSEKFPEGSEFITMGSVSHGNLPASSEALESIQSYLGRCPSP